MGFRDNIKQYLAKKLVGEGNVIANLPKSRVSHPDIKASYLSLQKTLKFVKPGFEYEYIPLIRQLLKVNSSVSLAATSIVELANPGFTIDFDKSIPEEKATKLRKHINSVSKQWGFGTAGLHGIVNKLILQAYIGGAMSTEWVLKNDLKGIKYLAFINPETIRVAWNPTKQVYGYWQKPHNYFELLNKRGRKNQEVEPMFELNPITYQYLALVNDEEAPIGIPPFLSAIDDLKTQLNMLKNIGYVSDQIGLMGFLEVLMKKPKANEGEKDTAYGARMTSLLGDAKDNIKDGLKDGIVAGFIDDHEFNFHAPSKDTSGAAEIFDINHKMVANGLFTSPQFMGGSSSGSETMVSIVFTKMLSQLSNIQAHVALIIERGIQMELTLMGEDVGDVKVKFRPSTITDDVKYQQARETKQRVNRIGYADGIYSLHQYARDMGEVEPDQKEPRVDIDPDKVMASQKAAENDQAQDNIGDKTTRDKKKAQPKRKDQDPGKRKN